MTDTQIEVSQRARGAAADWAKMQSRHAQAANMRRGSCDTAPLVQLFARFERDILATHTDATPVAEAWAGMEAAMQDPDYAWGWHCNLAVPIMDATGITHEQANMAAAHLMQHLWKCDITTHPHYQYEKSGAQAYAEFRIDADKVDTVIQADIDAARSIWHRCDDGPYCELPQWLVQAFAAHRATRTDATPVAWRRRRMWDSPSDPAGMVHLWEPCSAKEATGHFDRTPGYEYRALYTRPPATDVAALVEAAKAFAEIDLTGSGLPDDFAMNVLAIRQALAPFTKGQP
jgi:hypothetical protein